jgi:hypothetical protein
VWYAADPDDPVPEETAPPSDQEAAVQDSATYLNYSHCLRGHLVVMENIVYWSSAKPEILAKRVADYLEGLGASVSQSERRQEDLGRHEFTVCACCDGRLIEAEVTYHDSQAETCVYVTSVDRRATKIADLVFPFNRPDR